MHNADLPGKKRFIVLPHSMDDTTNYTTKENAATSRPRKNRREGTHVHLNTLPSATGFPPMGLSQVQASRKNSLSASDAGSNFLKSYDSQSGATSNAPMWSSPRTRKAPLMAALLFSPRTRRQPKRNLRDASRRLKNPVIKFEVWKIRPRSSGY